MTTVGKLFDELVNELEELYSPNEAENIMRLVFQEKLGLSRVQLALQKQLELDDKNRKIVFQIAEKLMEGQPVQQLIGSVHFLNARLRINKNVLIPRPETEELVQWIVQESKDNKEFMVLDIGTGSGCIAISLAQALEEAYVTALDISQSAIELARINAIANNAQVDFTNMDILLEENWKRLKFFDVIVSNPPYIRESEKEDMHVNVKNHEPKEALFVSDENPLIFYERISEMGTKHLTKSGKLYFEINEAFGSEVKKMLKNKGYKDIKLKKDISGKDRMVRAIWEGE
jgi:release factor glutamine methyltransferase